MSDINKQLNKKLYTKIRNFCNKFNMDKLPMIFTSKSSISDRYEFVGRNGVVLHKLPTEADLRHIYWTMYEKNCDYGIFIFYDNSSDGFWYEHGKGRVWLPIDIDRSNISGYDRNILDSVDIPMMDDFVRQAGFFMVDEDFDIRMIGDRNGEEKYQSDIKWVISNDRSKMESDPESGGLRRTKLLFKKEKYNQRIIIDMIVLSIVLIML